MTFTKCHQSPEASYKHRRVLLVSWITQRFPSISAQFCTNIGTPQQQTKKRSAKTFWRLDSQGAECNARTSKKKLVSPPTLALLNAREKYTLDIDARNVQGGCALLQEQPDRPFTPFEYWSRSLTKAEQAYHTK